LYAEKNVVIETRASEVLSDRVCMSLSGTFKGPCIPPFMNNRCDKSCKNKENKYSGKCWQDLRCWCYGEC